MPYKRRVMPAKPKNEKDLPNRCKNQLMQKKQKIESSIYQLVTIVHPELFPSLLSELLLLFCVGTNSGASPRSFDAMPLSPSLAVAVLSITASNFDSAKPWSQQGGSYCYKTKYPTSTNYESQQVSRG